MGSNGNTAKSGLIPGESIKMRGVQGTLLSTGAIAEVERMALEAAGKTVEIAGREYSTTQLHDPRKPEPVPEPVVVHTLQGFADLVNGDKDEAYLEAGRSVFVHVVSPTEVRLLTGIFGEFNQRAHLATAKAIVPELGLSVFRDQETFVIGLLANFEPVADREAVFKIVGNLESEAVQTCADDGVTQRATARAGIVKKAQVDVPNPVHLQPYRTFSEVWQPQSPFILRLRDAAGGNPPTCALFECDGGKWRLEAIQRVKQWLTDELGDVAVYG